MIIFELAIPTISPSLTIVYPFIYVIYPGIWTTGTYWTTTFGATFQSNDEYMYITSFFRDGINKYSGVLSSLAECCVLERSFYWEPTNQRFYVHLEHEQYPSGPDYRFGKIMGFCTNRAIYIDKIFYSPVLKSFPSLAQQQDLENYDQLSGFNGSVELVDHLGELDFALTTPCIGYDCYLGNLRDSTPIVRDCDSYSHSEIQILASFYVEKQNAKLSGLTLHLQDLRIKQNIDIPTELFTLTDYPNLEESLKDKPIPLLYGSVRALKAICVNGVLETGTVEYRVAQELDSIGTVQVKKKVGDRDVWVTVTPTSITLATGSFTLSSTLGRNSSGTPYDCRMLKPNEATVIKPGAVIKALNLRYYGTQYTDTEYNKIEWEASEALLKPIGILFDTQIKLYEAIRIIQSGSNIGLRYEYNSIGQCTLKIDDWTKTSSFYINVEDIANIDDMEIETDPALLAATIKINYSKDYTGESDDLSFIALSMADSVRILYRQEPQLEFDSLLQSFIDVQNSAYLKAMKYGTIHILLTVKVLGHQFLPIRIYDVGIIQATPKGYDFDSHTYIGNREWVGVWKVQVLSINPDLDKETNELKLVLIDQAI